MSVMNIVDGIRNCEPIELSKIVTCICFSPFHLGTVSLRGFRNCWYNRNIFVNCIFMWILFSQLFILHFFKINTQIHARNMSAWFIFDIDLVWHCTRNVHLNHIFGLWWTGKLPTMGHGEVIGQYCSAQSLFAASCRSICSILLCQRCSTK